MRCEEARSLLDAYLDSDLGPDATLSLAGHLEACPTCAEVLRQERRMESRIRSALSPTPPWGDFWKRLERKIARRPRFGRPAKALVAAATFLFVLSGLGVWRAARDISPLAAAALADHRAFLEDRLPLRIENDDPNAVLAYVRAAMPEIQAMPEIRRILDDPRCRDHAVRLVGATACHLDGVPAILVAYRCCDRPVSVFILRRGGADRLDNREAPSAGARIARGAVLTVCVAGGHEDDIPRQLAQAWAR